MDKQPATVEKALNIAIKLEAYELALQANGTPPSTLSKGEGEHPKTKSVRTADSSTAVAKRSEANQLMQKQILKMQQEFAEYRNHASLEEQPTPQPSTGTQVHTGSSRKGMTASQAKSKGGSRGRVQCTNCDKFGHRAKDCARPPRTLHHEMMDLETEKAQKSEQSEAAQKKDLLKLAFVISSLSSARSILLSGVT